MGLVVALNSAVKLFPLEVYTCPDIFMLPASVFMDLGNVIIIIHTAISKVILNLALDLFIKQIAEL